MPTTFRWHLGALFFPSLHRKRTELRRWSRVWAVCWMSNAVYSFPDGWLEEQNREIQGTVKQNTKKSIQRTPFPDKNSHIYLIRARTKSQQQIAWEGLHRDKNWSTPSTVNVPSATPHSTTNWTQPFGKTRQPSLRPSPSLSTCPQRHAVVMTYPCSLNNQEYHTKIDHCREIMSDPTSTSPWYYFIPFWWSGLLPSGFIGHSFPYPGVLTTGLHSLLSKRSNTALTYFS